MKKINIKSLLFHTLVPLMIGFTISMLIGDTSQYYNSLNKPIDVPRIVFPIVWSILYILMGFAAYIIDNKVDKSTAPMKLYYLQLLFNFLWPIAFFGVKMRGLSVIIISILFLLVLFTTISFFNENKWAGLLMVPYLLWTAFATYLCNGIYFLNLV